jgi:MFS family permease
MGMTNVHDSAGASGEHAAPLTLRRHLTLSFLWLALNFQSAALLPIVLPVQIVQFVAPGEVGSAQQAVFLGVLTTAGGVLALFVPPLVGALSDRTRGPLGRRRPYIVIGAVLLTAGAYVLASPRGVLFLLAGLLIFQVGGNTVTAGYQGLLPDQVPESQRGAASGYIGLMTILGNAGSLGIAALLLGQVNASSAASDATLRNTALYYTLTGIVLAGGALFTVLGVHERPLTAEIAAKLRSGPRRSFADAWLTPWRHRDFTWVFLTRASVMLGLGLFMTFIEYYFAHVAQIPNFVQQTAALAILALAGAALSALTLGILSDRVGRVALVCFATICMSVAALAFVVLPRGTPLWPLGILFGVGFGAYSSVDWALAVDVLPSPHAAGKDMGIWSVATTLPAILAPLLGALVLTVAGNLDQTALGYRAVFGLAVFFLFAGAVCILLVRDRVATRRRGTGAKTTRRRVRAGWRLALRTRAGRARGFLRFWPFWERVTIFAHRPTQIPHAPYNLLWIEFARYKGSPIVLPDGTRVEKGDLIGEVHIRNREMAATAPRVSSWKLLAMLAEDLRALAAWMRDPAFPAELRAFYGFTILGRGAARLGFTLRERPRSLRTRLDGFFLTGLLVLYNPRGRARLTEGTTYGSHPVEVWLSRDELLRRYGNTPTSTTSTTSTR